MADLRSVTGYFLLRLICGSLPNTQRKRKGRPKMDGPPSENCKRSGNPRNLGSPPRRPVHRFSLERR